MGGSGDGPGVAGPGAGAVSIRVGNVRDASAAALFHGQLISEGFLSSLGSSFLRRLYRRIVCASGSFLLVAEAGGSTIGFIAGSVDVGRLYRSFLLRDGVAAGLSAPVRLVSALPSVLETLNHGRAADGPDGGELLAVAVDPSWRGRHVGGQLVEGFLDELERRAVHAAHVVVGADNATAITMYHQAGFSPTRTFEMHRGTESILMETVVPSRSTPDTEPGS
jgi:ribosomal protein S18 acetylase RimI-like enzyme